MNVIGAALLVASVGFFLLAWHERDLPDMVGFGVMAILVAVSMVWP